MANKRKTRLITKNSDIVNRPLPNPSDLLSGESIVNTAEGRMLFLGVSSSTDEFVPAGIGDDANFFEVGSNLYDLQIRNRITKYEGLEGSDLAGKFLSGTTNGFVLADIGSVQGIDSYVISGSYDSSSNEITLSLNEGKPDVVITDIDNTFVNGGSITTFPNTNSNEGEITLSYEDDLGQTNVIPFQDTFVSDASLSTNILKLTFNDGTDVDVDLSGLDNIDTFVTNFTYSNNVFTIERNQGQPNLTVTLDSVSGLTVTSLTPGRVVYVGIDGELKDGVGFEYDENTGTLLADNINTSANGSALIGTGGLIVGSGGSSSVPGTGDVVINGSLTIFGETTTASTGELYVEDKNITLNYSPDSNTAVTSIGAGFTIQDGDGIDSDVSLEIRALNGLEGLTPEETPDISEYTGLNGFTNRGFVTEVNDIILRSNDKTKPNGVRVLTEFDILDGGTY